MRRGSATRGRERFAHGEAMIESPAVGEYVGVSLKTGILHPTCVSLGTVVPHENPPSSQKISRLNKGQEMVDIRGGSLVFDSYGGQPSVLAKRDHAGVGLSRWPADTTGGTDLASSSAQGGQIVFADVPLSLTTGLDRRSCGIT